MSSDLNAMPGSPNVWGLERDDDLIDIFLGKPPKPPHGKPTPKSYYEEAVNKSSNPHSYTPISGADYLRRLHPKHSLVMTSRASILNLPGVAAQPLENEHLITNSFFIPLSRRLSGVPGILVDQIEYGAFKIQWNGYDFLLYQITYPFGFGSQSQQFILHEGPEEPARLLLLSLGTWEDQLHEEVWFFDQGWWQKSHSLWVEVQRADWDDIILKDEFKKALQKDIYGFFDSEKVYKDLGIPWKRGLIMWGPPGNGKTISVKAIIKTCADRGFVPLYVKSFRHWMGDEGGIAEVFQKARQLSPCVIILEDLDSLIHDGNRSFFLNQVDGLEGNDGLLMIGTTNHFDRLDPGLSTRPSRFDRKYKFDDPDKEERTLYAQYWQKKLKDNSDVEFSDSLVKEIADLTDRFSFAYLKEAFVSTLVELAGIEGEKPSFGSLIKQQISTLRKQLDKAVSGQRAASSARDGTPIRPPRPSSSSERDIRRILDALSDAAPPVDRPRRVYTTDDSHRSPTEEEARKARDVHALMDELAAHLETSDAMSFRRYETPSSRRYGVPGRYDDESEDDGSYRALLDRLTERERDMRIFDLQQHSHQRPRRRHMPQGHQAWPRPMPEGRHGHGHGRHWSSSNPAVPATMPAQLSPVNQLGTSSCADLA
ncbi:hypothetical protein H1R20_g5400, partial [Candolleomyces eurysporus]